MFRTIPCLVVYSKATRNLPSQEAPKLEAWKGLCNFFLVSEIYTITTENLRPRFFINRILQGIFQATCSTEVLSRSLGLGGGAWESSCHLLVVSVPRSFLLLGLSFLSCKMGAVPLNEANRVVVRLLFENKIISNWKWRIYIFDHSSSWACWR